MALRDFICEDCKQIYEDILIEETTIECPGCGKKLVSEISLCHHHFRGDSATRGAYYKYLEKEKEQKIHMDNIGRGLKEGYAGYSVSRGELVTQQRLIKDKEIKRLPKKLF